MSDRRVAQTFAELADTLVERFDNIEFLHVLAERRVELLAADSAGTLLADEQGALEPAKGVLTERLQIDVADALPLMRNYARNTNQLLSDIAGQVNARSPAIAGLTRINQPRYRW